MVGAANVCRVLAITRVVRLVGRNKFEVKMIYTITILYMTITSRMSGGGLGAQYLPRWLTWLPELFFAAGFGYAAFQYGGWIAALLATAWSYIWMQTGHGTVLHWGRDPAAAQGERKQFLTPLVNRIADRLGFTRGDRNYCRLFMTVKGFLIGLPAGGLPLAVLWPLGYELGYRLRGKLPNGWSHAIAEFSCGMGAGVAILLAYYMT